MENVDIENTLIPKVLERVFCLFLKFGQAILVRVLMLDFWNLLYK